MGGQSVFMIEVSKGGQGGTPLPTTSLQTKSESVIVGYYTSAEVPFPRRRQPGVPLREPFVRRTHIAHGRCEQGFQGAQYPWHTALVQSLVCYTSIKV